MAIAVNLNFNDVYNIETQSNELTLARFETELSDGTSVPLIIDISQDPHELIPSVYNLAFGPPDEKGNLDDRAEIKHKNYSKVFSTILFHAQAYLTLHPDHFLGIDGSDNARAYLYYRFIIRNYDYLSNYFSIGALKYYVRMTRFGKEPYENPFDFKDIKPDVTRIQKNSPKKLDFMYNYFIFKNIA